MVRGSTVMPFCSDRRATSLDIGRRHDLVALGADDQEPEDGRGEEGEIIGISRRRHRR